MSKGRVLFRSFPLSDSQRLGDEILDFRPSGATEAQNLVTEKIPRIGQGSGTCRTHTEPRGHLPPPRARSTARGRLPPLSGGLRPALTPEMEGPGPDRPTQLTLFGPRGPLGSGRERVLGPRRQRAPVLSPLRIEFGRHAMLAVIRWTSRLTSCHSSQQLRVVWSSFPMIGDSHNGLTRPTRSSWRQ